ncbi:chemotaxis protein CheW [Gloeocapsa sp. PCC 73106]|uniref:chemotaxis protein CheW n=1 Tax=Gloeocapsa sp. PCC 73106 TaxID=102232 RepID=UPI0002ACACA8|nr:chemotaxis protein CheW [Gloeocapsa sp. PCC 73106]ELR98794.1 chemotaxis signal transduction protein [Gloeocapsa sp. PCC 73106]
MSANNKLLKIVLFKVGSLYLAFNIDAVQKVTRYTPVLSSGLNHFGVVSLDDREITVVDLHKRLFHTPQPRPTTTGGYLLLVKNSQGESFAIVVGETPSLIDVPTSQVRALPESYRRADTLEIATHVTILSRGGEKLTAFLLDTDQLVPPIPSLG